MVVINLNPLIKLDGYYFFTEWLRVPDLKERSTSFLIGWVQRHIFRLPVEVPMVSRRRVPLFVLYALRLRRLQLLAVAAVHPLQLQHLLPLVRRACRAPGGLLAFVIFRSRLRGLRPSRWASTELRLPRATAPDALRAVLAIALLAIPLCRYCAIARMPTSLSSQETHQVHTGVPERSRPCT